MKPIKLFSSEKDHFSEKKIANIFQMHADGKNGSPIIRGLHQSTGKVFLEPIGDPFSRLHAFGKYWLFFRKSGLSRC